MDKPLLGIANVVILVGALLIVGFLYWAYVIPPGYSVPPTVPEQLLGQAMCIGGPVLVMAACLFWYAARD